MMRLHKHISSNSFAFTSTIPKEDYSTGNRVYFCSVLVRMATRTKRRTQYVSRRYFIIFSLWARLFLPLKRMIDRNASNFWICDRVFMRWILSCCCWPGVHILASSEIGCFKAKPSINCMELPLAIAVHENIKLNSGMHRKEAIPATCICIWWRTYLIQSLSNSSVNLSKLTRKCVSRNWYWIFSLLLVTIVMVAMLSEHRFHSTFFWKTKGTLKKWWAIGTHFWRCYFLLTVKNFLH